MPTRASMSSASMPGRVSAPGTPESPCSAIRVATAHWPPISARTASRVSSQNRPRFARLPP